MNKHIERNKENIKQNEKKIDETRTELDRMRTEYRFVFDQSQARMERIIHRLIIVVVVLIAVIGLLVWGVMKNKTESVISNDTTVVSGEGSVSNGTD